jgi:hypothetical protein
MKIEIILIGLFLSVLYACNSHVSDKEIVITEFPSKQEIKTSIILTDSVILDPDAMFIMNSKLWILQKKNNVLFDIFSLPDGKYLFSTGNKGQGPDDFIHPISYTINTEVSGFSILDRNILKTIILQPNNTLHVIKSEKTFEQMPVNGFVKLNDSLFCAFADCATGGTVGEYEYCLKNKSKDTEIKFSKYPDLSKKKFKGDERCQIYYKWLVANSNERKIAAFYSNFKFLRFYSAEGDLLKEIRVNVPPYQQTENIENREERKKFYGKPIATDHYIYAPCSSNEIQVWDWNGNPIIQYALDKKFSKFAVSENDKKIYMVSWEESDLDKIYTFELSHLP